MWRQLTEARKRNNDRWARLFAVNWVISGEEEVENVRTQQCSILGVYILKNT